jgi:hypothetical protein
VESALILVALVTHILVAVEADQGLMQDYMDIVYMLLVLIVLQGVDAVVGLVVEAVVLPIFSVPVWV